MRFALLFQFVPSEVSVVSLAGRGTPRVAAPAQGTGIATLGARQGQGACHDLTSWGFPPPQFPPESIVIQV